MIFPGQSLTAEPKNAPYENAPEMVEPEEVVMWHLRRLAEDDRLEALLGSLELGVDVVTLTEGLLRGAVLNGRHSIDVSLIVAPVVHEFIKNAADAAKIDYEEGFPDDSEKKLEVAYTINSHKAKKMLSKVEGKKAPEEAMPTPVMPEEVLEPKKGLMSRREEVL